jgi:hypothetical protein
VKYWNRSLKARELHWTRVTRPLPPPNIIYFEYNRRFDEVKRWCQQQKSTGRFFMRSGEYDVWFERPEDATWFLLNWP